MKRSANSQPTMTEEDYFLALEYRICSGMQGMRERRLSYSGFPC